MKKIFITIAISFYSLSFAYGASLSLVQTKDVYSGRVVFDVMLDPEGEIVNAFSGTISIPDKLFEVESISTLSSVSALWLVQPNVVRERDFLSALTARSNLVFEGALPGGFDGIRSPYYEGRRAGKLFSFTLRPKAKGTGMLVFLEARVLLNDGKATPTFVTTNTATLTIPDTITIPHITDSKKQEVFVEAQEKTLNPYITRDQTIGNNAWIVIIRDDVTRHTLLGYYIAESNTSIPEDVPFFEWREATSPYVLLYQKRNRFVHVKALYQDSTQTIVSLPPVENTSDEITLWRILVSIGIGIIVVYALQKRHVLRSFFDHSHKHS